MRISRKEGKSAHLPELKRVIWNSSGTKNNRAAAKDCRFPNYYLLLSIHQASEKSRGIVSRG